VTAPQPSPRPHGCLWEIMSFLGQLLIIIIILATLAAAVLWLFGFI
jgi:hypothetical protein